MYCVSYYCYSTVLFCRRLYHCFAFVWLFLNIFVGIFAAILRILMTAIFSLLLVMRMDRNVLMKGFEKFDIGKP